jgi:DinB superfamily
LILNYNSIHVSELQELLERFRRGAELLAVVTTGAAGPELDFAPAEGKWGVRMIVCHLADVEAVNVMRFRQMIAEENPTLVPFDQDKWAANLDYKKRKISQPIETFRRLRGENYELLKEQPEAVFARTGNHLERGSMTVLDMLRLHAEHVEKHVRQIQAVRAAYKEHRAKVAATPAT